MIEGGATANLTVGSELAAFDVFVREQGLDFSTSGVGVTAEDWLADAVSLISASV